MDSTFLKMCVVEGLSSMTPSYCCGGELYQLAF